jgi:hypothetical protein
MAIDSTKYAALMQLIKDGRTPAVAEILTVNWSDAVVSHYAITNYSDIIPHRNCSLSPIEPRLLGGAFHGFEINSDLQTESISFTFANIDRAISDKFDTYGEGVNCELSYYWADVDLLVTAWWGQLNRPSSEDYEVLPVLATNGFRSKENLLPSRIRPRECTATFGARFDNLTDLETNGCPYNRHLGGAVGNLNGGVPYVDCPKLTESDCSARLGNAAHFLGFRWDVVSVVTDGRTGYQAQSKGSGSTLKQPIRVIFGYKIVNQNPQLFFRREINQNNPDHSFVRGVFEVSEGPVDRIFNLSTGDTRALIQTVHQDIRNGHRAQSRTGYASNVPNFSFTAHFATAVGWINAAQVAPASMVIQAWVHGYKDVKVYTDVSTSSRVFSNNRVWCLLELYTNKRFGRGYSHSKFEIADWLDAADWTRDSVRFTYVDGEGVAHDYDHIRTMFDCAVEGRPAAEVITDICRSGRISVPFQSDGKYTIRAFKALTSEELEDVKVFTDKGHAPNIAIRDGRSSLSISQTSDKELVNEVQVSYENAEDFDTVRPITIKDEPQKVKAGESVGARNKTNAKSFFGFGIRTFNETFKLAHSLLWFGEFDEGGTKNNCRVVFNTTFEQTLNLKRYDVIKIESDLLASKGYTDPFTEDFTQFQYFRILRMPKSASNQVQIIAQAYNQDAYTEFETVLETPVAVTTLPPPTAPPCVPAVGTITYSGGFLTVPVEEC